MWGAAKFSAALIVFLALLGHILGLSFIQFGERPRMEKLYDRGLRQDAGLLVRSLKRSLATSPTQTTTWKCDAARQPFSRNTPPGSLFFDTYGYQYIVTNKRTIYTITDTTVRAGKVIEKIPEPIFYVTTQCSRTKSGPMTDGTRVSRTIL